jgi:hypothetical protein
VKKDGRGHYSRYCGTPAGAAPVPSPGRYRIATYWHCAVTCAIIGSMNEHTDAEIPQQPSVLAELENRIHELEHLGEEHFGAFTPLDWFICTAGSLVLPYACYLWFWP